MPQKISDAVHRYYIFDASSNTSQCKLCGNKLKGKHTSNLKNHLAGKHVNTFKEVTSLNKERRPEKAYKKKTVTVQSLCVKLIAVYGRPLDMIDDEPFQEILQLAAFNSKGCDINKEKIKEMIPEVAYKIRLKIASEIKHKLVVLKLDTVICVERKFLGINIQFIKDNKIMIRNLAVLEVTGCPTEEYLTEKISEVLDEFAIPIEQVYIITTDNGNNLQRPAVLMGGNFRKEEDMNTGKDNDQMDVLDEDDDTDDSDDEEQDRDQIAKQLEYFEISHSAISNNLTPEQTGFRIQSILCAAHTLQLAIKDAINRNGRVQHILEIVRKVVKILRIPSNRNMIRQANLKVPMIDCPTRWTSTFMMLVRVATLGKFCENIYEVAELISSTFWAEIDDLISCLETLYKCCIDVQKQQLTVGDFFITWYKCKTLIDRLKHHLAANIHNAMEVREKSLLDTEVYLEALYLDGRLNVLLSEEQCQRARSLLKQTLSRLQNLKQSKLLPTTSSPGHIQPGPSHIIMRRHASKIEIESSEDNSDCSLENNDLSGIQEMLDRTEMSRRTGKRRVSSFEEGLLELRSLPRLPLDTNIINYWSNKATVDSDIVMVAFTVLATPVTQVSVKRLFSSLKFILSPLRNDLCPSLLQNVFFIRSNQDLLE